MAKRSVRLVESAADCADLGRCSSSRHDNNTSYSRQNGPSKQPLRFREGSAKRGEGLECGPLH